MIRWADRIVIAHPGRPTHTVVGAVRRWLAPVVKLCHRPTLTGLENLPEGPFLLVANHSAGLGVSELSTFMALYLEQFGAERPLAGFAIPIGFRTPGISALHRALGSIPSTYTAAAQTLAAGVPILVFPGGDYETLRPIWQANRVDFGGRLGFLRIAREHGVPIVPFGIRGGHFTAPVLFRSRMLATLLVVPRALGQKRWGVSLLGVLVTLVIASFGPGTVAVRAALCWLWLGSPLVFLPWVPWTLRLRIGTPIPASALFAGEASDEQLGKALVVVQRAVQALVDREPSGGASDRPGARTC